ncbi:MAG: hypothetical protein IPK08_19710 [Bacteroidetes bacterium]|nr:hypothetical protein [Bacteroidota bacterium]
MNFLKKLFGFGSKNEISNSQVQTPVVETAPVDEVPTDLLSELFVDKTPPVIQQPASKPVSRLQEFINGGYANIGYNDGYSHHNAEFLQQKLAIIRAEFRQIVDEAIDNRRSEIFLLKNQQIETRGLSERLEEQIELRIAEIETNIGKLEREKGFSVEDEGLVMKAIHEYRDGFLRGCKEYQEAKLFAQSTGCSADIPK